MLVLCKLFYSEAFDEIDLLIVRKDAMVPDYGKIKLKDLTLGQQGNIWFITGTSSECSNTERMNYLRHIKVTLPRWRKHPGKSGKLGNYVTLKSNLPPPEHLVFADLQLFFYVSPCCSDVQVYSKTP